MFKTKAPKSFLQPEHTADIEQTVLMDTSEPLADGQPPVEDMIVDSSFEVLRPTSRSSSVDSMAGDIEELKETLGGAPLGRAFGHIIKELARLKVKGREQSRAIDTEPICRLLKEHMEINQTQDLVQQELVERLRKLEVNTARFTEQGHFERLYKNPLYCTQIEPPSLFGSKSRNATIEDALRVEKLFPKGNQKFSGTRAGPPIIEFLARICEVQAIAKLPEEEFKVRLMNACTGEPYLECKNMIESGMSTAKIFFQLEKRYDTSESPLSAIQKLDSFKVTRDMNSKAAEGFISKLATVASRSHPKGPIRTLQTDLLCIRTYLDSLPARASDFVRERCNDLTIELGRAPQFGELGTVLDPHRYFLDSQIANYGKQANKKGSQRGTQDHFRAYQGPSYQVNAAYDRNSEQDQGNDQSAGGRKKRSRQAQVNQLATDSAVRTGKDRRNDEGFQKGNSKQSSRNQKKFEGKKRNAGANYKTRTDKFCTLCGYTNHTAADGCRQMIDEGGEVVKDVTPTWGACTKSQRCQDLCLRHPERYCPEVRRQKKSQKQ